MQIHQINLQPHLGGGEVYTAFLCRALDQLGVSTTLYCHPEAHFWHSLDLPSSTQLVPAPSAAHIKTHLPTTRQWLLTHGPMPSALRIKPHLLTTIAHMPSYGRRADEFAGHDMVFAVSRYVINGLVDLGIRVWEEPLYGVASLTRTNRPPTPLKKTRIYDWDGRKVRDRVLSLLEPLIAPLLPHPIFTKRSGISLGIVSRLTPIKQFPQLFSSIAAKLAQHPRFNLDIFGSGGYATVRDMKAALRPIQKQTRFWGQQKNVVQVYAGIDYLLTGLPEKEALGLNVIEAQACGVPVLAINAPPFTETVVEGETGYFYTDPRLDGGADFARLLAQLEHAPKLDPRLATQHLARFSFESFCDRLRPIVAWAQAEVSQK